MRGKYHIILFLVLFIIVLFSLSNAEVDLSRPTQFSNDGLAENESYAFDNDNSTFSLINTSGGNISYYLFYVGSHQNSEDIRVVDVFFDIEVQGMVDDLWSLQYSEDDGLSWNDLRSLQSGNLARQILNFSNLLELSNNDWTWDEIRNDLLLKIETVPVSGVDSANINLYELYLNVTYDGTEPSIFLLSPQNNANFTDSNVTFIYNVTDELSGINNCSLLIDANTNLTNQTVSKTVYQYFNQTFEEGIYSWNIICYDNSSTYNMNTSEQRQFSIDLNGPTIVLNSPNETDVYPYNNVTFSYQVSDISSIVNCSLLINDQINKTNISIMKDVAQQFISELAIGSYNWSINCTDINGFSNKSEIRNFSVDVNNPVTVDVINISSIINLNPGTTTQVLCNTTISDIDDGDEIQTVIATLYHNSSSLVGSDENSVHYTNASCTETAAHPFNKDFSCGFNLWYFAKDGEWNCHIYASDNQSGNDSSQMNFSVQSLYAINISPQRIDYGYLFAGNTSQTDVDIEVSNLGNKEIDITLDGYGIFDGDGLAMNCTLGEINVSFEHYSLLSGVAFNSMTPLSDDPFQLDNFNLIPKNDTFSGVKSTYWKIRVPKPKKGSCDGFVTFAAVAS